MQNEKSDSAETPAEGESPSARDPAQLRDIKPIKIDGEWYRPTAQTIEEAEQNPENTRPIEMLIPGIAARDRLTLLHAREKTGKSTLLAFAVSMLSQGKSLWGHRAEPMRCLWVGMEEAISHELARFGTMEAHKTNVAIVKDLGVRPLQQLKAEVLTFRPDLVVVDSFSRYARDLRNENDAAEVGAVMHPLSKFTQQSGAAIVLLHHSSKNSESEFRGSGTLGAAVDIIVSMKNSAINPAARVLSPRGRAEDLENFLVVYDRASHEFSRVGHDDAQDALDTRDVDLEQAIVQVVRDSGPTFKSQFRTRLQKAGVGVRGTEIDAAVERLLRSGLLARQSNRAPVTLAETP